MKQPTLNPYKMLVEVNQTLLDKGVPIRAVAEMSAIAVGRMNYRAAMNKALRNMIQIQPMPQGALPIYDRDLDVADIITDEGDDE